jgi:hypothetical protein
VLEGHIWTQGVAVENEHGDQVRVDRLAGLEVLLSSGVTGRGRC